MKDYHSIKYITPIKRPDSLNHISYKSIKNMIISAKLHFEILYSVQKLADILGTSRTPVREALLKLASEGLVDIVKNRGFKLRKFSKKEVDDFFETRKMIEIYAIEQIIETLTEEDFTELHTMLSKMDQSEAKMSNEEFINIDRYFHFYLISKLNNNMINSIIDNIRDLISLYGMVALSKNKRRDEVKREHKAIFEGLMEHNAGKASEAMENHLDITRESIVNVFKISTAKQP